MTSFRTFILGLGIVMLAGSVAVAQDNPCNPCGGKSMSSMDGHGGTVFSVEDPMNRNTVTFKSSAPLEDIIGTSHAVTGHIAFDPSKPKDGGHGKIVVPVASLTTGIPLRDEHLASAAWLNAEANPNIEFEIVEVKKIKTVKSTKDAETFELTVVGNFSLNGRTKRISVPARVTYLKQSEMTSMKMPGDLLAARTSFEVALADFGITGPEGMNLIGSKVGETVEVELSLMASNAGGSMAGNPCGGKDAMNPCGDKAAMNPCGDKSAQNPCNPCGGK